MVHWVPAVVVNMRLDENMLIQNFKGEDFQSRDSIYLACVKDSGIKGYIVPSSYIENLIFVKFVLIVSELQVKIRVLLLIFLHFHKDTKSIPGEEVVIVINSNYISIPMDVWIFVFKTLYFLFSIFALVFEIGPGFLNEAYVKKLKKEKFIKFFKNKLFYFLELFVNLKRINKISTQKVEMWKSPEFAF
jgi:hypothetical protein